MSIEDGVIAGGVGEEVQHVLALHNVHTPSLALGIEDEFVPHGSPADLMKSVGLDAHSVAQRILDAYHATQNVLDGVASPAAHQPTEPAEPTEPTEPTEPIEPHN